MKSFKFYIKIKIQSKSRTTFECISVESNPLRVIYALPLLSPKITPEAIKWASLKGSGNVVQINEIFAQLTGIDLEEASKILKIACTRSLIPEPLRLAHLIASGVRVEESRGRA